VLGEHPTEVEATRLRSRACAAPFR
jgi:hypothetical protein